MKTSINRLVSRIRRLQAKADRLTQAREAALAETHQLMNDLDRAVAAFKDGAAASPAAGRRARGRKPGRPKGFKVPAKFRGPSGETWSGRGLTPVWLRDAVKKGKKKEDFLIKRGRGA